MPRGGHPYEGKGGRGSYDSGIGDGCGKGVGSSRNKGDSKDDFGSRGRYYGKNYDSRKGDGCGKGSGSGGKGYSKGDFSAKGDFVKGKSDKGSGKNHLSTNLVSVLLLVKSMAETTPTIHQQIDKLRLKLVRAESENIESLDLVAD